MTPSLFVIASLLFADVPSVAALTPADALAVIATDDLAELTRRARTLPAAIEFSHDEWRATVEHVSLLAGGLIDSMPPEWTRSGLDLNSVRCAFAALVPDGERSCCIVIGLKGREGKPPTIDKTFLLYPGAGVEGDVLVVGTRAAALDRARAVVRGETPNLAGAPLFRDRLADWARPTNGLWAWSDRDVLVDAQARGLLDLGPFVALVEQKLGHAYAWTLDIVDDDASEPTIATTTWIATDPNAASARPAFERANLRVVPRGTQWFQTLHWDPAHVLESCAAEIKRGHLLEVLRAAEKLSKPQSEFVNSSRDADRISVYGALVSTRIMLEDLASNVAAFRNTRPLVASVLTELRPPLVIHGSWPRLMPQITFRARVANSEAVARDFGSLIGGTSSVPMERAGVAIHAAQSGDIAYAIVDDWLVVSTMAGIRDAIDRSRDGAPSIDDDPRFRPAFDRLCAGDGQLLDVCSCDLPSLLSAQENLLLGALMIWSRFGAIHADPFALPVLEHLPDVAPASVGVARTTPRGVRIDRLGFLGGEFTGLDGLVGIAAGLAPIVETHVEIERAMDRVRDDLRELGGLAETVRHNQGRWYTFDELSKFVHTYRPYLEKSLNDPWGAPYRVDFVDAHHCRLSSLGADQALGGEGLDTDIERVLEQD